MKNTIKDIHVAYGSRRPLFPCHAAPLGNGRRMLTVKGLRCRNRDLELELREQAAALKREFDRRRRAEAALLRIGRDEESIFDSLPDPIAILDDSHRIIRVNRAMARRLGAEPTGCIGQQCFRSVHGTAQPPSFCPHVLTLADGREHSAEVHEERLGGHFLVTTTPLRGSHGVVAGTLHVAREITERKRVE
ncbi:MAG TPA: PAS domain-containing protein, partial [Geobacteraceae bacterium]|nr:PAS domain-containing protein [Geobacteraceae bacterium]